MGANGIAARMQHSLVSHRQEASDTELLKHVELGGVALAAGVQQLRHLMTQLEGSALKAHVGTRADL